MVCALSTFLAIVIALSQVRPPAYGVAPNARLFQPSEKLSNDLNVVRLSIHFSYQAWHCAL